MTAPIVQLGRYELLHPIASGGMATVYEGKLVGPAGFARRVAIKRMHPQFASDPEFVAMFLDEARLAARIRHPNVVATLDVVTREGELLIVMDYVQGETLAMLARQARERGEGIPAPVALAVLRGALAGLHAAHEACEDGVPLGIVHRDVSPQNLLVGVDGVTRILDFGIAKASGRAAATREGELKGKLRYMSPEQVSRRKVDRRSDVYAAAAVLWEVLTGRRLIDADDAGATVLAIVQGRFAPPSSLVQGLPAGLDAVVARGLAGDPDQRFGTALEMARALEPLGPAPLEDVGAWVQRSAGDAQARGSLAHISPGGRTSLATATLPAGDGPLVELVALDAPVAGAEPVDDERTHRAMADARVVDEAAPISGDSAGATPPRHELRDGAAHADADHPAG
ncbi:MAG: serine/threonine-protein kinase, partial [Polyangiaceae bacterium]